MTIPRVLVVYYSRTRRTDRLAHAICNSLEIHGLRCDLEPLREPVGRHGLFGYLRSTIDAALARTCPILPLTHKLEDYDVVIVGSPIWNSSVSTPVRSFLCANADRLKRIAFFLTYKTPRVEEVFAQMEALVARPAVAQLMVRWPELSSGDYKLELRPFVEQIEQAAKPPVSTEPRVVQAPSLLH